MRALLLAALVSCAPVQRMALRRCPTVQASLTDFALTVTALGMAALADTTARKAALGGVAVGMSLGSHLAECHR